MALHNSTAIRPAPVGQLYRLNCGAAGLLQAALALRGAGTVINHHARFDPAWTNAFGAHVVNQQLQDSQAWETTIYQWTSRHTTANPPPADPDNWGENMPSAICECAQHLGLNAVVEVNNLTVTVTTLRIMMGAEVDRITALGALRGRWRKHSPNAPVAGRELKLLITHPIWDNVMHYMLVRPGGQTYDPATAIVYNNVAAAKTATHYHGTGLSIYLQ